MTFSEENLANIFDTDIEQLKHTQEDDLDFIEQNHFGDMLIEKVEENNERYKLWRNLDCNNASIEVEYSGKINNWTWETVLEIPLEIY